MENERFEKRYGKYARCDRNQMRPPWRLQIRRRQQRQEEKSLFSDLACSCAILRAACALAGAGRVLLGNRLVLRFEQGIYSLMAALFARCVGRLRLAGTALHWPFGRCRRVCRAGRFCGLRLRSVLNDEWVAAFGGVRRYRSKNENQGNYGGKVKQDACFHRLLPWETHDSGRVTRVPRFWGPRLIGVSTPDLTRHSKYNLLMPEYHERATYPKVNHY